MNEPYATCATLTPAVVSHPAALLLCELRGLDPHETVDTPDGPLLQWQAIIYEATLVGNCMMLIQVKQ